MQSLILPTRLALQRQQLTIQHNRKSQCQLSQHTHLLSHSHRDGGNMECHGYRVGTGDWATHHCHHRRLQGNHIFVPTSVDSSSTGECGLFSKHHDDRLSSRCSRYCSFLIFTPAAVCWWAKIIKKGKNNNNNNNKSLYFQHDNRISVTAHMLYEFGRLKTEN